MHCGIDGKDPQKLPCSVLAWPELSASAGRTAAAARYPARLSFSQSLRETSTSYECAYDREYASRASAVHMGDVPKVAASAVRIVAIGA